MAIYALTIFTGAFLLFLVQPLIARYILPWFGGTPAVWTTCMLFFQMFLLAGYAYAHLLIRKVKPRSQVIAHLVVLLGAVLLLPITPADRWKPAESGDPAFRILALLLVSLGLPYVALSATGPLVQAWFSRAHPGRSPYRLYALSNVGSLLALIAYPTVVEPNLGRQHQARLWSAGMIFYAVICAIAAVQTHRTAGGTQAVARDENAAHSAVDEPPRSRLLWFLLPACGSVLLLAVTNKICQDVAVIPFLWVLPLSLYLLTFVICFDSPRWYWRPVWLPAMGAALAALMWLMLKAEGPHLAKIVGIHVAAMFVCCMVLHGELYRLKPSPRRLTGFYLLIAAGGAVGGLFVALIAPAIFTFYFELHWGILATCVLVLLALFLDRGGALHRGRPRWAWALMLAAAGGIAWGLRTDASHDSRDIVARTRNFYGVLTLLEYSRDEPEFQLLELQHGGITHGSQYMNPPLDRDPTTYYSRSSGIGRLMDNFPKPGGRRVGLIGLGAGTLTAYGQARDWWRIYEINPVVLGIARDRFTFLKQCPSTIEFALGDARLSLEREPSRQFDILILDAFSSDSVPVHLLTREAFEIYRRHMAPEGVIAVHVSNRYLNLRPVVQRITGHFGYTLVYIDDAGDDSFGVYTSDWMLLTNNKDLLGQPELTDAATELNPPGPGIRLWTDEESNLFRIVEF